MTARTKSRKPAPARTPGKRRAPGHGPYGAEQSYHTVHAGPWIVWLLGLGAGITLNAFTGTTTSVIWVVALVVVCTGGLAYSAFTTARQRSAVARWHSIVTVVYSGAWLALCTVTGVAYRERVGDYVNIYGDLVPDHDYHLVGLTCALWLIGGGFLASAWNLRIGTRIGEAKEAAIAASMNLEPELNVWEEALNTEGVRVRERRINEFFTEGTVRLSGRGNTLESLRRGARQLEVANGWPYESLTLAPHPTSNNAKYVKYLVQHADPLAKPVVWPGLALTGKSGLFDPLPKGVSATGEAATLRIVEKGLGGLHRLVVGMNGSGKTVSEAPDLIWSAALGADNIVIDTVKRTQSYGELAPIMQLFVIDPGMARALIERLMSHTLPARTEQLARERLKTWEPRSKLNFLRLHVEEAWQIADAGEIVDIALAFRSAGGQLIYSIQRPTFDQMPVTLRSQLSTVVHFGITEKDDEQYALPDEVRDAGAHPAKWRNDSPGMHYAIQGDMTLNQKTTARRAWQDPGDVDPASPNSFANTAAKVGRTLHEMDPVTAGSLGDLWASRVKPADLVAQVENRKITPGPATQEALTAMNPDPPTEDAMHTATALPSDIVNGEVVDAPLPTYSTDGRSLIFDRDDGLPGETFDLGGDVDPARIADPYAALTPPAQVARALRVGMPSDPGAVSREEYTQAMEARLAELLADPNHGLIIARDFVEVWKACKWSRPSVYDFLEGWTKTGRVAKLSSGKGWLPVRSRT